MNRFEVLKTIVPTIRDRLVVCNIGSPSQELRSLCDQDSNFYMLGTMGLCSSIGLGLAMACDEDVIAIDGDGSILTNLGTLATIANNPCRNFVLLIIDNGSYGSTGDQPTYAGGRTSLTEVARSCGCQNVIECSGERLASVLPEVLESGSGGIIVCKCEPGQVAVPVVELDPVVIAHRFSARVSRGRLEDDRTSADLPA